MQQRCLELAADFATRSADHDRDGSHPTENYDRLRAEGFLELTVPLAWGGTGAGLLDHTIAYEALGQGCPSTALAFNMHASVVMPVLLSAEVPASAKQHVADLVVRQQQLLGGNFSEPGTTSLIGERPLSARAKAVDGGYSITGRKMFASMLEAADQVMVMAYPDGEHSPFAGMLLLVPRIAAGRRVDAKWNTLGMRATRSDSLILEDCLVPDSAVLFRSDDTRGFRRDYLNWFWGSYTAVYLGVAVAAYDALRKLMHVRQPQGYAQGPGYPVPQGYGGAQGPPGYGGGYAGAPGPQAPRGYVPSGPGGPSGYPQPYPSAPPVPLTPPPAPAPPSVMTAVRLMYAGAAFTALEAFGIIVVAAALIKKHSTTIATTGHTTSLGGVVAITIFFSLIEIGLWLGIAQACRNGRNWARITGTVLFGLHTLGFLDLITNAHSGLGLTKVLTTVGWLIACGAVVFLWRRPSGEFFRIRALRR